jgi:hypothetical protein
MTEPEAQLERNPPDRPIRPGRTAGTRPSREGLPLPAFEAWSMHASTLLVGGTGLVYAWMIYLAEPDDPFSIVNHPWQPSFQHLHVFFAPLLVFFTGLIWRRHVWNSWRLGIRPRRRSGLSLALSLVPMVASGYLVQVTTDETWRNVWSWVHLATSLLWIAGYLLHQFLPLRRRLKKRRD